MSRQILTNLRLFDDSLAGMLRPVAAVVVADGRVEAVIQPGGPVPVREWLTSAAVSCCRGSSIATCT